MRVVVVAGPVGASSAATVARLAADARRGTRRDEHLTAVALDGGGAGLLDAVSGAADRRRVTEVAGPFGHPLQAPWLLRADGTAVIAAAAVCGQSAVEEAPGGTAQAWRGTSFGVGQLVAAAHRAGAERIVVGVAEVAVADAGAGALSGLGMRLRVDDGSGLKIGADELHRISMISLGWAPDLTETDVVVLSSRPTALEAQLAAPADDLLGGAVPAQRRFAEVVERDLVGEPLRTVSGTAAGNGLAYGLCAGTGALPVDAFGEVVRLSGAAESLAESDEVLVVTDGEHDVDRSARLTALRAAVGSRAAVTEVWVTTDPGADERRSLTEAVRTALPSD